MINSKVIENPKKEINKLVLPIFITFIIGNLNSLVDMAFVGYMGTNALAALGLLSPFFSLVNAFGSSIGVGINVLMSKAIGDNNNKLANTLFNNGIFIAVIVGLIITLMVFIFNKEVLGIFGVTDSLYNYASDYSILFVGSAIFLIQGVLVSVFNVELKSIYTTFTTILTIFLNIIFNSLAVYYFHIGISGIAISTVLSSLFVVLISGVMLNFKDDWMVNYKINYSNISLNFIKELLNYGIPAFLESSVFKFVSIIFNYFLLVVGGSLALAAYTGAWKFITIGTMVTTAYGNALLPIASMFFGKKDINIIKELYRYVLKNAVIIGIIMMIIFNLFGKYMALLLTSDPILINNISYVLGILSIFFVFIPFNKIAGKILVTIGHPRISLYVSVLEVFVLQLLFTSLAIYFDLGVQGLYVSRIMSIFIIAIISSNIAYKYIKNLKFDEISE